MPQIKETASTTVRQDIWRPGGAGDGSEGMLPAGLRTAYI